MDSRTLNMVAEIQMGQSPPGHTYNEDGHGLPFFQGVRDFNYRFPTSRVYCTAPTRIADQGDILLSIRAPIGRVNVASERCATGRGIAIIRPRDVADARYIEFVLRHMESYWNILEGGGAVFGNAKRSDLESVRLPWPENPCRRKIAAILSAYDDLIENNLRRIKVLEEMAQNLYREWFVKFRFPSHQHARFTDSPLGRIPEGWEVKPFSDEIDILSGGTPNTSIPEYWNGEILWMTPKDIKDSFYVMDTERKITELGLSKCNSRLYPAETVFITARGTVGRCVLAAVPMAMSQTSYALTGRQGNPQHYVYLLTLKLVDALRKAATGAVFDTIVVDTFKRQYVAFPPIELRNQFVEKVMSGFGLIKNLLRKNNNLRRTRDLLLPRLIFGEVDVSELDIAVPEEAA